ncbi:hypothetical protein DDD_0602 [Nonlabens dokdonensis DSW-6]|uniref:Uncharacterized protein n=1 Tax=Nonlabens dokdonensis (strain DSM 17205 / KCTC 12402 / DSW-6) TaxID=592029 RepID=L7W6H3_NONDD|nr:hypothetical protein DDD_0602 [Nonlabens dokdonensis DSW-6]
MFLIEFQFTKFSKFLYKILNITLQNSQSFTTKFSKFLYI